ncbi:PH domain-containing protein [Microbacterium sp. RD1]|uniref:PH domain-containing protein n=1 Tax=Microbacterium sp. RD1 TaxID=3457313 RepID=UPI003FA542D2
MPRIVFRSTFNRVLSIVAWVLLAAVAAGTLLTPGAAAAAPALLLGSLGGAALVWALLWAPYIAVDDDEVHVANIVAEYRVPWAALIHVDTRYALQLHTPGRRISATGAPAPGALGAVRAARAERRSESPTAPGVRPGDLPSTDSGSAAALVRGRWEQLRDSGRIELGVADSARVVVRARVATVAAIVLGAGALVAAVLLV